MEIKKAESRSSGMKCDELKYEHLDEAFETYPNSTLVIRKQYVDAAIAELEESHKMEVEQLLIEIAEMKNRIAPIQSDKTLQERLNEVCEKHGVSTLQDLDWAFCESEKRRTKDCIEADKVIAELKENHKKEVEQLLMKIAGLEKLVETADKLLKSKGGFTVKDVKFGGVKLEGTNTHKKEA